MPDRTRLPSVDPHPTPPLVPSQIGGGQNRSKLFLSPYFYCFNFMLFPHIQLLSQRTNFYKSNMVFSYNQLKKTQISSPVSAHNSKKSFSSFSPFLITLFTSPLTSSSSPFTPTIVISSTNKAFAYLTLFDSVHPFSQNIVPQNHSLAPTFFRSTVFTA